MKKKNDLSLKFEMFKFFAIFIAVALILLWLFQIVFLGTSYKLIKTREIKSSANKIVQNFNDDYIEQIAMSKDFCVLIMDSAGNNVFSIKTTPRCTIHKLSAEGINYYINKAMENGGEYLEKSALRRDDKEYRFGNIIFSKPESIVYTRIVNVGDSFYVMMLDSNISPIDATVSTLREQLLWITLILVILAGLLAFAISKKIASPIEKVTKKAKKLAKGEYEPEDFDGGYKEINELVNTLNYAAVEIDKNEEYRRELIANVSHDLRTPLTMIIGYSEMIRDYPEQAEAENIQTIIDEAKRLNSLVNDTLDFAKYESGAIELNKKEFSLTKEIGDIIDRFSTFTDYNIVFNHDEDIMVNADELQISQVIYNLLTNAINYTGDDKLITINQIVNEGKVKIEIIDTGEGIAEDKLPDIWQRYYKIDKTHKRSIVGSGLGLSIVKTILLRHSAEFGVKSKIGEGSTFWFELDILDNKE
ncbi:HAMP domain-containing sensor histidine kinase [uncultured Anaerofustis sp.]|uniref:sensor histidine kinase n=1 Tax=uncultured Anaerofustis sp. TaxID=904996 RepID=UPI0025E6F950|nr:HAMP domain-containing sensor histidine kinase [uncultured Anaerofustis sp.]